MNELGNAIASVSSAVMQSLVQYVPSVLGAVLLLVAGWLLAKLLRIVVTRGVLALDTLVARVVSGARAERPRVAASAEVLGTVVFWVVLLFFITAATKVLGLDTFTNWLGSVLQYLPTLAAGALIVAAGYLLSTFVRDLVTATASRLEPAQRSALARTAQGAILVTAILVGADQIGVKVTFLAIVVAAVAAAVVGSITIAASLGARSYVANLIGAHYLRQSFEVGQRIRVSGHEGRILQLTALSMVLETADGRVTLPGRVFNDEPIVILARDPTDG
jgi:small-conductance mechanosensitive channel